MTISVPLPNSKHAHRAPTTATPQRSVTAATQHQQFLLLSRCESPASSLTTALEMLPTNLKLSVVAILPCAEHLLFPTMLELVPKAESESTPLLRVVDQPHAEESMSRKGKPIPCVSSTSSQDHSAPLLPTVDQPQAEEAIPQKGKQIPGTPPASPTDSQDSVASPSPDLMESFPPANHEIRLKADTKIPQRKENLKHKRVEYIKRRYPDRREHGICNCPQCNPGNASNASNPGPASGIIVPRSILNSPGVLRERRGFLIRFLDQTRTIKFSKRMRWLNGLKSRIVSFRDRRYELVKRDEMKGRWQVLDTRSSRKVRWMRKGYGARMGITKMPYWLKSRVDRVERRRQFWGTEGGFVRVGAVTVLRSRRVTSSK